MSLTFDIEAFLREHGVHFIHHGEGPNVKKGNINIQCPWCGDSDHSQHMGISLEHGWYGCWRNPQHRSKHLHRLIQRLIGCTMSEAKRLIGEAVVYVDGDDFEKLASGDYFEDSAEVDVGGVQHLELPDVFYPIDTDRYAATRFLDYLSSRGFADPYRVARTYDLAYCFSGKWKDRVIIPVYVGGELISWTARSIHRDAQVRYLTLETELSVMSIKDAVYNFDSALALGGSRLFVVEGPLDVIKFDLYARGQCCSAVGLFNMSVEPAQLYYLQMLADWYEEVVILLDEKELAAPMLVGSALATLDRVSVWRLPKGVDDPGELTEEEVIAICRT